MILLYHGIVPDDSRPERLCVGQALPQAAFEKHIRWLAHNHPIISLAEYLSDRQQPYVHKNKPIAITFDDGLAVTFQCVFPLLMELNIPAAIFISTGHLENGELLWFSYLKALCFENLYKLIQVNQHGFPLETVEQRKWAWNELRTLANSSGSPLGFVRNLAARYPLTSDVFGLYAGMTYEQIRIASKSNIFELGSHTVTHPYLDQVSREEQEKEILGSQRTLSELVGKQIRYFAYPGGKYNRDTLELVTAAGYEAAFAIISQRIGYPCFEVERMGIYSPSFFKYQLKIMGVADLARRLGMKVG